MCFGWKEVKAAHNPGTASNSFEILTIGGRVRGETSALASEYLSSHHDGTIANYAGEVTARISTRGIS